MKLYRYLLAALIYALPATAFAQCSGIQPAGSVCGNPGATGTIAAPTRTPVLGLPGTAVGTLSFGNATSGTVKLQPVTGALGTSVLSLPAITDTLVGRTAPTFVTSITSPLVIGGTGAASTLTLESTSGAGTTDSIVFKTGSQAQRGNIDTTGIWNVGATASTASTDALMVISRNVTQLPLHDPAVNADEWWPLVIGIQDGKNGGLGIDTFGGFGVVDCRRANGTNAAKTALLANDLMCVLGSLGYDGAAYSGGSAQVRSTTTENWNLTSNGARISIWGTPNGSTASAAVAELASFHQTGILFNHNTRFVSSLPALEAGTVGAFYGANSGNALVTASSFGASVFPAITLRGARGTGAAPSQTNSGDIIGVYSAQGYTNSSAYTSGVGQFRIVAAENFTSSAQGAHAEIYTTPIGSTATARAVRWWGSGGVSIGTIAADPTAGYLTALNGVNLGVAGTSVGNAVFSNATSGTITVRPVTGALGSSVLSLPAATGTLLYGGGPLGTPASGLLTNATGLPISTGLTGAGTGVLTALGVNVGSAGAPVLFNGALGTPSSGTLTNATGLPVSTGVVGLGTNVATALGVNVGTAGAFVVNGGALGTPSSGTLTSATGLPIGTGVSGLGSGVATFLATPSSANLASALTDENGTGVALFGSSAPTNYTATLSCTGGGSLANITQSAYYQLTGTAQVALSIKLVADLSTCAGNLTISLPFTANATFGAGGMIGGSQSTGAAIFADIGTSGTVLTVKGVVSGANPITGAGQTIVMSGVYFK